MLVLPLVPCVSATAATDNSVVAVPGEEVSITFAFHNVVAIDGVLSLGGDNVATAMEVTATNLSLLLNEMSTAYSAVAAS